MLALCLVWRLLLLLLFRCFFAPRLPPEAMETVSLSDSLAEEALSSSESEMADEHEQEITDALSSSSVPARPRLWEPGTCSTLLSVM